MRLTIYEVKMILKAFDETFKNGKVYLFGSRVDDSLKGGDIDLFIVLDKKINLEYEKKISFLSKLKKSLGEQKIDVVIAKNSNRLIEKEALKDGIMLDENRIRIEKYLNECEKHKLRIEKAYNKVKNIFPISSSKYEKLLDEEVEAIDQYLFRFAKLQDTIGDKLFKLIISMYVENVNQLTLLDRLNLLEKIGILEDKDIWKRLRTIRNDISHQYDDEAQEMAEALNNIFAYKDELLKVYYKFKEFNEEKFNTSK